MKKQNPPIYRYSFYISLLLFSATSSGWSDDFTKEELEAWFQDDARSLPFSTSDVNEGELEFLASPPDKPTLHSANRLTISNSSLDDGWVGMVQCYENLDAVNDAQVVYQYKQLRNLKVEKTENIEKTWIEGQSVQLLNTQKGATLCISAQVRIFYKNANNTYTLKNGPFQRRFLDGFYPMHVTLSITYPPERLTFVTSMPAQQPGFEVDSKPGALEIDAWFEGRLLTEMEFKTRPTQP
jgi:hypothetical protein